MNHLIGKHFRYKSPYGGISDWTAQIVWVTPIYNWDSKLLYHVVKTDVSCYKLDEIEIID